MLFFKALSPQAPVDPSWESLSPPPVLSSTDFPALPTVASDPMTRPKEVTQPHILPSKDEKEQARLDRRVAKKIAAAERAAEKERETEEKIAAEKERKERAREEKERVREEKERLVKEKKEKGEREKADKERERERLMAERAAEREQNEQAKGKKGKGNAKQESKQGASTNNIVSSPAKAGKGGPKAQSSTAPLAEPSPMPMLSKMPKKNKPVTKPIRTQSQYHKEDDSHESALPSATAKSNSSTPQVPNAKISSVSNSAAQSEDGISNAVEEHESTHSTAPSKPKTLKELLHEIDVASNGIHLPTHPFFDIQKLVSMTKAPMDSANLLKALSTFPTDCASGVLDDKTMASFRQLLETLTQTMSDLVQLLPQTTWGTIFDKLSQDLKSLKLEYSAQTSSSFDGLVIDDLADGEMDGEDDYDEADSDAPPSPVDRRARWMELQLAKLEELHRDVNAAAVRAILHENDSGSISRSRQRPGLAWGAVLLPCREHAGAFRPPGEGHWRRWPNEASHERGGAGEEVAGGEGSCRVCGG